MNRYYRSQISLITLVLCFCIGSLATLPMGNFVGGSGLEIFEFDIENDNLFEQGESHEDFIIKVYRATNDIFLPSKSGSINLDFQDFLLAPVSPPPKHA